MSHRLPRLTRAVAGLAVGGLLVGLAACGSDGAAEKNADGSTTVDFQLNFTAGGFNSGFALAKQQGLYDDLDLDVNIIKGNGSATTAQLVSSGQADIAYADAVPVMQLIGKGAPMKVVSTFYQANPNSVTSLEEQDITSIADLKGKSIGIPAGSSQAPLLPILYQENGLSEDDVNGVNLPITSMVPSLLQGKVDAILGSLDFYGIQLKNQGVKTNDLLFADNGVGTVSTSIIARDEYLENNPEVVRNFVAASAQGWAAAIEDPDAAIAALKEEFPDVDTKQAKDELTATIPLFCKNGAKSIGKAEPEAWESSQDVLAEVGTTPEGFDPEEYYTYDYLPDDLPSC